MSRTWLSIQVELVSGRGQDFWPRPGRSFAAARSHTFAELATAIDDAFARWDRAHLHCFDLGEDAPGVPRPDKDLGPYAAPGLLVDRHWEEAPAGARLDERVRLSSLQPGQKFAYVFDLGDDWAHLCTVDPHKIDPLVELGAQPPHPVPYWGWGDIPDQYGRRTRDDDGESPMPPDPRLRDLPPLQPGWGDPGPRPTR